MKRWLEGNNFSKISLLLSFTFIVCTAIFFYPKWEKPWTEATISWDVMGYYLYLPSIFIYNDIHNLSFKDEIIEKYKPTTSFYQAIQEDDSTYVMKYPMGASILYSPGFFAGHLYAKLSNYPADGFSYPYQTGLSIWSMCVCFLGLLLLRKGLLTYFYDISVGVVIIMLCVGTNYFNYTAIDHALTHNYLFTLYSFLIFLTIHWYNRPSYFLSLGIGFIIGLATITRPVEIISCLIPLLWGVYNKETFQNRLLFWQKHKKFLLSAVAIMIMIGLMQPIYWLITTNQVLFYSYEDQGFSFLSPHIVKGLISYRKGWLIYTPLMIFSLIGFYHLYKKRKDIFYTAIIFVLVNIYIVFSWDIWWYGGSLGQRALVQSYAILAFPLAALIEHIHKKAGLYYLLYGVMVIFIWFNLMLTYQAHSGILDPSNMTRAYFWKIFGKTSIEEEAKKLLDTNEEFTGTPKNRDTLASNDFSTRHYPDSLLSSNRYQTPPSSLFLAPDEKFRETLEVSDDMKQQDWLRAEALFFTKDKERNKWKMTNFIVRFTNQENNVKKRMIRVQRLLREGNWERIHIDVRIPREKVDNVNISLVNLSNNKSIYIDDLTITTFKE